MKRTIKHISYLEGDGRSVLESKNDGTFRYILHYMSDSRLKSKYVNYTAREFIYHEDIVNNDPVLTLLTGEKIRVFPGGDPSYLPAMVEGVLNKNDKREKLKRKLEEQKKKRKDCENLGDSSGNTDEYYNPFIYPGG